MVKIPKVSEALWKQLQTSSVDMPYFEAWQAHDVKALFDLGLVEFVRSKEKLQPAISVVLSAQGRAEKWRLDQKSFWSKLKFW